MTSGASRESLRPARISRGGWLDVLRFAAGALIILYYFREAAPTPLGVVHPVFDRGYLLTDFFIIDSDVPLSFHPAATRVLGLVTPRSVG